MSQSTPAEAIGLAPGPMHLPVAVGAPTVALFSQMPVSRWGHEAAPHRMVDLTPCAGEAEMVRVVEAAL